MFVFVGCVFVSVCFFYLLYKRYNLVKLKDYVNLSAAIIIGRDQEHNDEKYGSVVFEVMSSQAHVKELVIEEVSDRSDCFEFSDFNKLNFNLDPTVSGVNTMMSVGVILYGQTVGRREANSKIRVRGAVIGNDGKRRKFVEDMVFEKKSSQRLNVIDH